MNTFTLEGQKREKMGSSASKTLRKAGNVPCVLYGGAENVHFSVSQLAVRDLVYSPKFYKVNLTVDGVSKEHLDFLELDASRPVTVEIPIEFTGMPTGVREGGALMIKLRRLKVKTLPEHLIDKVQVAVDDLELGRSVKVSILDLPDIEIMASKNIPMASVEIPRVLRSEQAAEAEAEGVEGATEEGEAPAEEG